MAGAVVAPAVAAQILMDKMGMDSFFRRLDTHAMQASMLGASSTAVADRSAHYSTVEKVSDAADAAELGVEIAEEAGVDLIDMGVSFFLEVISGIDPF